MGNMCIVKSVQNRVADFNYSQLQKVNRHYQSYWRFITNIKNYINLINYINYINFQKDIK